MNTKLVWLFLLCFAVTLGNALVCYQCRTSHNQDCYSPINKTSIQKHHCNSRNSDVVDYQCVAYLERNSRTNSSTVSRHCVVKNDFDCTNFANNRRHKGYIVDECYVCDDDLCNSGQKTAALFALTLGFIFVGRFCM
ncbi:hypothetical protein Zmor_023373 [Zophobas morio]|uniref:Protein sleepless n=1 Tax=Zophobas morio TaxID=2755281 RepID=A0AA38HZA9_9CUCU|nr:hypothetical protein Zmor_023373 [Zophobas morio]